MNRSYNTFYLTSDHLRYDDRLEYLELTHLERRRIRGLECRLMGAMVSLMGFNL